MSLSDIKEGCVYHNGREDLRRIERIDRPARRCWYSAVSAPRRHGNHPQSGAMSLRAFLEWAVGEHPGPA